MDNFLVNDRFRIAITLCVSGYVGVIAHVCALLSVSGVVKVNHKFLWNLAERGVKQMVFFLYPLHSCFCVRFSHLCVEIARLHQFVHISVSLNVIGRCVWHRSWVCTCLSHLCMWRLHHYIILDSFLCCPECDSASHVLEWMRPNSIQCLERVLVSFAPTWHRWLWFDFLKLLIIFIVMSQLMSTMYRETPWTCRDQALLNAIIHLWPPCTDVPGIGLSATH